MNLKFYLQNFKSTNFMVVNRIYYCTQLLANK